MCGLCKIHEIVSKLKDTAEIFFDCPFCQKEVAVNSYDFEVVPVGETNSIDPDEDIAMLPVKTCDHCGEYIALMPKKIIWNANHDIYYTGGKKYLQNWYVENDLISRMRIPAKNFLDRLKAGETQLNEWHISCWLAREAEHYLAEKLFELEKK